MRKFVPALVLVVVLIGASQASAQTRIVTEPQEPFQSWANTSLAPTPHGGVRVIQDSYPRVPSASSWTIHWWPNDGDRARGNRPTFLHELGHIFDHAQLRSWSKQRFQRILEHPDPRLRSWRGGSNEHFAMAYSYCALGVDDPTAWGPANNYWGYGYGDGEGLPTVGQQRQACTLIHAIGADPANPFRERIIKLRQRQRDIRANRRQVMQRIRSADSPRPRLRDRAQQQHQRIANTREHRERLRDGAW